MYFIKNNTLFHYLNKSLYTISSILFLASFLLLEKKEAS